MEGLSGAADALTRGVSGFSSGVDRSDGAVIADRGSC